MLVCVRRLAVASVVFAIAAVAAATTPSSALAGNRAASAAGVEVPIVPRAGIRGAPGTPGSTPPSAAVVVEDGSVYAFLPRKLHVLVVSSADCSQTEYSFSIVNNTPVTQEVTLNGEKAFKLTASAEEVVCDPYPGSTIFHLKSNVSAKLKIISTVTPSSAPDG